jgi:hypothetical protein
LSAKEELKINFFSQKRSRTTLTASVTFLVKEECFHPDVIKQRLFFRSGSTLSITLEAPSSERRQEKEGKTIYIGRKTLLTDDTTLRRRFQRLYEKATVMQCEFSKCDFVGYKVNMQNGLCFQIWWK